jgi:hypothetical protein
MWPKIALLALAATLFPVCVSAQPSPQNGGPPDDMRAKMDALRADAKTSAFAALSDAHRAKVQSIVDAFDADGSTVGLGDASGQIDAVLTPQESSAVLAAQHKMRDAMRADFAGGPGSGRPGGFGRPGGGGHGGRRAPDAGRFLLQVDASPDRYRAQMEAERGSR